MKALLRCCPIVGGVSQDGERFHKMIDALIHCGIYGRYYNLYTIAQLHSILLVDQFAIFTFATNNNHPTLAGGKAISAGDILHEIFLELRTKRLMQHAIPEHLSILRSFQYVCEFRKQVADALTEKIETVEEMTVSN